MVPICWQVSMLVLVPHYRLSLSFSPFLQQKYYENPIQWGMAFQPMIQLSLLRDHMRPSSCAIRVTERSLQSSRHCFIEAMLSDGSLQPGMAGVLDQWHEFMDDHFHIRPDAIGEFSFSIVFFSRSFIVVSLRSSLHCNNAIGCSWSVGVTWPSRGAVSSVIVFGEIASVTRGLDSFGA